MKGDIRIEAVHEHDVPGAVEDQIRTLLDASFPHTFSGRTYFKQLPHVRLLAWEGQSLAGQVGLDHRVINVSGTVLNILGIIDLCVDPSRRGKGIGSALLDHARRIAARSEVDFILAMADRHDLYDAHGYRRVQPAVTKWVAIEERASVMLIERDLGDCFLARPVAMAQWPPGPIDLLGYPF